MFRVVPADDLQLKEYWCANLPVARKVARELGARYECDCQIVDVPERRTWCSLDSALSLQRTHRLDPIALDQDLVFACTQSELEEALYHSENDVVKISDHEEIFCFAANETFWQSRYASSLGS